MGRGYITIGPGVAGRGRGSERADMPTQPPLPAPVVVRPADLLNLPIGCRKQTPF